MSDYLSTLTRRCSGAAERTPGAIRPRPTALFEPRTSALPVDRNAPPDSDEPFAPSEMEPRSADRLTVESSRAAEDDEMTAAGRAAESPSARLTGFNARTHASPEPAPPVEARAEGPRAVAAGDDNAAETASRSTGEVSRQSVSTVRNTAGPGRAGPDDSEATSLDARRAQETPTVDAATQDVASGLETASDERAGATLPTRSASIGRSAARSVLAGAVGGAFDEGGSVPAAGLPHFQPRNRYSRRTRAFDRSAPPSNDDVGTAAAQAPVVHVTIGRVDIRATPPVPAPLAPSSPARGMTLADYLGAAPGSAR
jgi:hypothetical protein